MKEYDKTEKWLKNKVDNEGLKSISLSTDTEGYVDAEEFLAELNQMFKAIDAGLVTPLKFGDSKRHGL